MLLGFTRFFGGQSQKRSKFSHFEKFRSYDRNFSKSENFDYRKILIIEFENSVID